MERLRYILRAQREHYLPLKVIRSTSTRSTVDWSRPGGCSAGGATGACSMAPGTPSAPSYGPERSDLRVSRRELVKTAGITEELLDRARGLRAGPDPRTGSQHYDGDALVIARTAGELAAFGIEPRHLRAFKTAADREVGLVEQVVSPIRRSREDGAEGRAAQAIDEIAALSRPAAREPGQGRSARLR